MNFCIENTASKKNFLSFLKRNPFFWNMLIHAPKYLGASSFNAFLGLIMTKYYTHVLSPMDFGLLSLYMTFSQYIQNLLAFTVDTSFQRSYFDFPGEKRRSFLGTVLSFVSISTFSWCCVLLAISPWILRIIGGSYSFLILTLLFTTFNVFFNVFVRIAYNENQSTLAARQTVLQGLVSHGISFLGISAGHFGIAGRLLGQTVAVFSNFFFTARHLHLRGLIPFIFCFDRKVLRDLARYAIPAFSTTVLAASFSYLDRVFLNHFHSTAKVGVFALGMTIGQGMSLIIEAVSMALFPSIISELERNPHTSIAKLKRLDLVFVLGIAFVALVFSFFRNEIVLLISNKSYAGSADVIAFVCFGYVMGGSYKIVSAVLAFHRVTWYLPFLAVVSFGAGAIANYLLIPKYGELGAAFGFFLGAAIYAMTQHFIAGNKYISQYKVMAFYLFAIGCATWFFIQRARVLGLHQ